MQKDGLFLTFTHRSFQEYFSAHFITRSPTISLPDLLDQISKRNQDSAIPMSFEMNRQLIEGSWVLPRLTNFKDIATQYDIDADPIAYLDAVYGGLRFVLRPEKFVSYFYEEQKQLAFALNVIARLYSKELARFFAPFDAEKDRTVIKAFGVRDTESDGVTERDVTRVGRRINSADNEWFRKTSVHQFFVRRHEALIWLLKEVQRDAARQKTILGGLFA
jgi:hypothetical protein